MRHLLKVFAIAALLAGSLSAHADTFTNYNISGTLANSGGSYSSTFTIDAQQYGLEISAFSITTTGSFTNAIFNSSTGVLTNNLTTSGTLYAQVNIAGTPNGQYLYLVLDRDGSGGYIVCSLATASTCGTNSRVVNTLNYGDALAMGTAVAAAPEPSSLALLGTGVVGLAGIARRRFLRS